MKLYTITFSRYDDGTLIVQLTSRSKKQIRSFIAAESQFWGDLAVLTIVEET